MTIAVIFIIIIVNCFFDLTFRTSNAAITLAAHDEKKSVDFTVKKALSGIRIPVHLLAYTSRIFADIMVWFDEPMLKIPS